jgi:hypothetical protein
MLTRTPCSRRRSRASPRPDNSPNSPRRKPSSRALSPWIVLAPMEYGLRAATAALNASAETATAVVASATGLLAILTRH